jgi:hypothetical protein
MTAARKAVLQPDMFFQTIEDPSVKTVEPEPRMVNIIEGEDWRAPIMAYLHHHYELDNNIELLRMQQRVKAYQVIGDELYKTLVAGPLLRCLSRDEGKELLAQTHSGICEGHIGSRALPVKVFKQGFYWPSIIDEHQNSSPPARHARSCHQIPKHLCNHHISSHLCGR